MRVDKAYTPESGSSHSVRGKRGDLDAFLLSHDDRINDSPSIDEQPDLSRNVTRDLHHGARLIERDNLRRFHPSAIKIEQPSLGEMIEALDISVKLYALLLKFYLSQLFDRFQPH